MEESGRDWMAIVWLTSIEPSWTDICRLVTKAWMIFQWRKCPRLPGKRGGREGGMVVEKKTRAMQVVVAARRRWCVAA